MTRPVRIGNAHGFWGDRIEAAAEMLAADPDLDFVTLDFLAEVSMSILALQRSRNPEAGWPRDILEVVRSLTPYWRRGGGCRMIANGGGLNPIACAKACQQVLLEAGCGDRTIAVVHGDDVLEMLRGAPETPQFKNLDSGDPLSLVTDRLVTANAYLGAKSIAEALEAGADLVITGRVADPSLTVGACAYFHNWNWDDWDRLAQATVAGHLIECGTQVTGGISTDWLTVPHSDQIGFPIVEIEDSGSFAVTKPNGSGGWVTEQTVKEQLVYEIGDPGAYLSPDVTVSFLSLEVHEEAADRVRVRGAKGQPPPSSYKVSATYRDGFRAQGHLTVYGDRAVAKARAAGESVLARLQSRGVTFRESLIECLGTEACHPAGIDVARADTFRETVLRIAVADGSEAHLEKFSRELMPLVTAGPPGTTGYAEGRPRIHPVFRYWPCLIDRDNVIPIVTMIDRPANLPLEGPSSPIPDAPPLDGATIIREVRSVALDPTSAGPASVSDSRTPRRLADLACTRSGDKGRDANIGVIARRAADYELLYQTVTCASVATYLGLSDASRVIRYELPNLGALNFIVRGILSNTLRTDAQGKTLGQVLLNMPLNLPFRPASP